jgi:hypothetical protein
MCVWLELKKNFVIKVITKELSYGNRRSTILFLMWNLYSWLFMSAGVYKLFCRIRCVPIFPAMRTNDSIFPNIHTSSHHPPFSAMSLLSHHFPALVFLTRDCLSTLLLLNCFFKWGLPQKWPGGATLSKTVGDPFKWVSIFRKV